MSENPTIGGFSLSESRLVPRDSILIAGQHIVVHPVMALRLMYPKSPVWCERTLGNRELQRDRRKYRAIPTFRRPANGAQE